MEPTIARSRPEIVVTLFPIGRPTACAWPIFPTPTASSKSTFAGLIPDIHRASLISSKLLSQSPGSLTDRCVPFHLYFSEKVRTLPTYSLPLLPQCVQSPPPP